MDERGSEVPAEPEAERHQSSAKGPRWRRITSWVLVVLACLLAVVSVLWCSPGTNS